MRQACLVNHPLHLGQHALGARFSVESDLHSAMERIEGELIRQRGVIRWALF